MKLPPEILSEFQQTKQALEHLAAEAKRDLEWSNNATTNSKHIQWSAPEVFKQKNEYTNSRQLAIQKYESAISVLSNTINKKEISEAEIQTLSDTQIPKLVQVAAHLKLKS